MGQDRRFRRIYDGLRTAELVQQTLDAQISFGFESPFGEDGGDARRFLEFYSSVGLRRVLEAYGIHRILENRNLGGYKIRITSEDGYDHRMQVQLDGREGDEHRLIDLKVALKRQLPGEVFSRAVVGETPVSLLAVKWLLMQDPKARFSAERPPMPGQLYPGLGIAYTMHNVLLLMARRLDRDGLVTVPERFHLALFYLRYGYLAVHDSWRKQVLGVAKNLDQYSLAVVAWAEERQCLRLADGTAWRYEPGMVVAPVSKRLRRAVDGPMQRLRRAFSRPTVAAVSLDLDGLRRSLAEDPVSGLDPDALQ